MLNLIVLNTLLVTIVGLQLPQLESNHRIVGGNPTTIQEHPYQVSLQYFGSPRCGGAILNKDFVITAAHCTINTYTNNWSIRAGSTLINSGGIVIPVKTIKNHPNFNTKNFDYDVAVLELQFSLNFDSSIQSIPIKTTEIYVGTKAVCTGWGMLSENIFSFPQNLQEVTLPIISRNECKEYYNNAVITSRMICAGYLQGGKDSCQGDSGGPLVANGKLVGIVSWGRGCARPKSPGVYANVAELHSFITQNSKQLPWWCFWLFCN